MKIFTISYDKWEHDKDVMLSEDQKINDVLHELGIMEAVFIVLHNGKRVENNLDVSFKELDIKENEKIEIVRV